MKEINLTNSDKVVLVDDEDYEELSKYKWRLNSGGYAYRSKISSDPKSYPAVILIHRQILGVILEDCQVDHKNLNKLDNLRNNIRKCTRSQNMINRRKMNNSQCEYKGVFRGRRKYITKFAKRQDGKLNRFTIGSFKTQEEAAAAYDQTMRLVYGEFTYFNFPGTYIEILDTNELINRLEQNNLL